VPETLAEREREKRSTHACMHAFQTIGYYVVGCCVIGIVGRAVLFRSGERNPTREDASNHRTNERSRLKKFGFDGVMINLLLSV